MEEKMRVMSQIPLNAETPVKDLRTWITDNDIFFKRNQGQIPEILSVLMTGACPLMGRSSIHSLCPLRTSDVYQRWKWPIPWNVPGTVGRC